MNPPPVAGTSRRFQGLKRKPGPAGRPPGAGEPRTSTTGQEGEGHLAIPFARTRPSPRRLMAAREPPSRRRVEPRTCKMRGRAVKEKLPAAPGFRGQPSPRDPSPAADRRRSCRTLLAALRDRIVLSSCAGPAGAGKTTRVPPALLDAGLAGERPDRHAGTAPRRRPRRRPPHGGRTRHRPGDVFGYQVRFDRQAGRGPACSSSRPASCCACCTTTRSSNGRASWSSTSSTSAAWRATSPSGMVRLVQQNVRPGPAGSSSCRRRSTPSRWRRTSAAARSSTARAGLFPVEMRYEPRAGGQPVATWRRPRPCARLLDGHRRRRARLPARPARDPPDGRGLEPLAGDRRGRAAAARRPAGRAAGPGAAAARPAQGGAGDERGRDVGDGRGRDRRWSIRGWRGSWSSTRPSAWTGCGCGRSRGRRADQRAGRAGRTRPGRVRAAVERGRRTASRPEQTEPEIRRVDLAGAVLQLLALGESGRASTFPWLDAAAAGDRRRQALGCSTGSGRRSDGRLTDAGPDAGPAAGPPAARAAAARGAPARCAAGGRPWRRRCCRSATRSPRRRRPRRPATRRPSDVLDRVEALEAFEREHGPDRSRRGSVVLRGGGTASCCTARDAARSGALRQGGGTPHALGQAPRRAADEALLRPLSRRVSRTGSPAGASRAARAASWSAAAA